ncbi:MAG: hypothetical protein V2A72_03450 [Candidatus Omnitrophota bacterium]
MKKFIVIVMALILALPLQGYALRPMAKAVSLKTYIPEQRQRLLDTIEWMPQVEKFTYQEIAMSLTRYCNMYCEHCALDCPILPKDETKLTQIFILPMKNFKS